MKPHRILAFSAIVLATAFAILGNRPPGRLTTWPPGHLTTTGEAAYWWNRALGTRAHNGAAAIVVSRFRFQRLKPLRSWQDVPALRDYVEWADRPEAAAFENGTVTANVSANDLILLRRPAASLESSAPVHADPLGYAVLDPGRAGWVRIPVTLLVSDVTVPALSPALSTEPVPSALAAVARDASTIEIYGSALQGKRVRVYSRRGEGSLLYVSALQVNARVPSLDEVSVEVDGFRTEWIEVQK